MGYFSCSSENPSKTTYTLKWSESVFSQEHVFNYIVAVCPVLPHVIGSEIHSFIYIH